MSKIAFLDVDGTLTTGKSSWEKVHLYFNLEKEMKEHSSRYFAGEIDYYEWAHLDVGLWKGKLLDEIYRAVNPPELINGASEGVSKLQRAGYTVILLSGGIDIMVNSVKELVGADDAYSNIIGHTDGKVDGTVVIDVGQKSKLINKLVKDNGIDLSRSIAIGDNFNDIDMFEMVGYAIAFNPKNEELQKVADETIYSDNFIDVVNTVLQNQ